MKERLFDLAGQVVAATFFFWSKAIGRFAPAWRSDSLFQSVICLLATCSLFQSGNVYAQSALRLNGIDGRGHCANMAAFPTSNSTWEAWVKYSQVGARPGFAPILFQFGLWAFGAPVLDPAAGVIGCSLGYTSTCSVPISPDVWHHVAVVMGPEASPSATLYLDGVQACVTPAGVNVPAPTTRRSLVLGANDCCYYSFPNFSNFLGATVDEVRLSSVRRYSSNFAPPFGFTPDSATIGLWHLDDGAGSTAIDSSGNGFHFALAGGFAWVPDVATPSASYLGFGSGCSGTLGVPSLHPGLGSLPRIGQAFRLQIDNVPVVGAAGVVIPFLGFNTATSSGVSLPRDLSALGLMGCTQYVDPVQTQFVFTFINSATWNIQIPFSPALNGLRASFQAAVADQLANPVGVTMTNAGSAVIGS